MRMCFPQQVYENFMWKNSPPVIYKRAVVDFPLFFF